MLDLPRINRIELNDRPRVQRFIGWVFLTPNYGLPPRVRIDFENFERVPKEPVIYAMNHTDRYNYWPFQYHLWRAADRYTATWVKGKYYENKFLGQFMELTNNIPTVSRGYLITKDFNVALQRAPSNDEYRVLRDWVNAASLDTEAKLAGEVPKPLLEQARNPLGRAFEPTKESYADYINDLFRSMMKRFVELNAEAFDKGLDVLIFPQGTRSKHLSKGHIGLSEIALKFKRTVVPVGCNGTDRLYPGGSPVAKGGDVVYRFGEPLHYDDMKEFHIDEDYAPFTAAAEEKHREKFQGLADVIMDRINPLLDSEYQYSTDHESEGVEGTSRFV